MEKITFGADLPGYEAGPKAGPAVIVLQEWWGKQQLGTACLPGLLL
jgi:dienelactone hydrolase